MSFLEQHRRRLHASRSEIQLRKCPEWPDLAAEDWLHSSFSIKAKHDEIETNDYQSINWRPLFTLFRRMPKPATISAATIRFHILATLTTGLIGKEIAEEGD